MRFQSNAAFSKLAPQLVADAYGPFTGASVTAGAGTNVTILPNPPAGFGYRIRSIVIQASTTTFQSNADVTVIATGVASICGSWSQATAIYINWTGDIFMTTNIILHNALPTTAANASIVYRQEPLPA